MSPHLDKALCEAYPLIFKQRHGSPQETAMCWGFSCGDGWFNLLDALCENLYADYLQAVRHYEYTRENEGCEPYRGGAVVTAVDVERARLKMKAAEDAVPVAVQVKEKFGTLRFYVRAASDTDYALIRMAESMSARTCEECGKPGHLRGTGWLSTLCDEHAD